MFFIQGCSQKSEIKPTVQVQEKIKTKIKPMKEKKKNIFIDIENVDALDKKINLFINEKYGVNMAEQLVSGIHYDLEYVNTAIKTEVFVKYKNSIMFCGSGGCSGEMIEYKDDTLKHIESFTLIKSVIYLIHDLSKHGFSKVVIPVPYLDENDEYAIYYNVYEPFSSKDNESVYSNAQAYKELEHLLKSRKSSIKLFEEMSK